MKMACQYAQVAGICSDNNILQQRSGCRGERRGVSNNIQAIKRIEFVSKRQGGFLTGGSIVIHTGEGKGKK